MAARRSALTESWSDIVRDYIDVSMSSRLFRHATTATLPGLINTIKDEIMNTFSGLVSRTGWIIAFTALLIPGSVLAQSTGTVAGTVSDASNGDVLTGANISVIGQTRGVTSNIDGSFTLTLPAGTYQLRATYI